MNSILKKTLGGLSTQYYLRHLFFSLMLSGVFVYSVMEHGSLPIGFLLFIGVSTLLYPYSRFVYESIIDFILGDNAFLLPAIPLIIAKIIMMIVCLIMAILIAPIGLAYLYYHHSKPQTDIT